MENNIETKPTEVSNDQQVETSQQDDAIASAKARVKAKYEKEIAENYVAKQEYDALKTKLDAMTIQVQKPIVENKLLKAGMKKEAVNDFLKLNPDAYSKSDADLDALVAETKKSSGYMFSTPAFQANALPNNTDIRVEDKQKPLYTLDANGFVIRNKK